MRQTVIFSKRLLVTVLALVMAFVSPVNVVALAGFTPPEDISNREKAHLNITFTGGGDAPNDCVADSSLASLTGSTNMEKIYNYFIGKGLTPEQAAGVLGNISVESGGNPLNAQVGPDTKDPTQFGTAVGIGKAWGLIQWDAGGRSLEYAKQAGVSGPIYELLTQLDIVWWHMNNSSPTSSQNMYADYQHTKTVAEATSMYEQRMEGAGEPHLDVRIERAQEALRQYRGGSDTSAGTSTIPQTPGTCGSPTGAGGGVASANGFTFPLITTQAAIKQGSSLNGSTLVWCYVKQTNCHHDYNAADLMIPTGTTVIAAKAGKVQNVHSGNEHPNNVTITTDDGQGINYYTHMGANTVVVRAGQHVSAGTPLGKVGTSEDAMGTAPHLHFDMLPSKYEYRPACSDSACAVYPFMEVQPALTEVFKKLPEK